MTLSQVIQSKGVASGLFSSALFCLWLSIASVSVWFDAGPAAERMTAKQPAKTQPQLAPAEQGGSQTPSQATPATGQQPDAA